ncbi:MAG: amidohydrolase [Deltaproteobacteria bacterium HGW-Deltaproteobacteria-2]|jgi:5-methylthioadenosine/S-adenosylhomocysteine deaminase|nr:MAG: amidohydrolase [Deltaproteobacteria bacterium HGW-Deltaproteobacteria-2]
MQENNWDIVITGGTLMTMSARMEIIEDSLIGIKDGIIVAAGKNTDSGCAILKTKETIDASGCIVMPGLVNTHTHIPMVCFRGMADDLPLMEWLSKYIWPAEMNFVNKEMVYDGAMLAMAEMILSGTTTFCDGYFFEDTITEAVRTVGMRAVVSQGFADVFMSDKTKADKMMAAAKRFVKRWQPQAPMITPAYFCHSPYTCSPDTLVRVKDAAREDGILYLMHLLENKDETDTILNLYGKKPVQLLFDLGVLDEQTIAVHCNWLTKEDMAIFADLGVKVSHNPESSMKLASGVAPVPEMLKKGIVVGIGTDGCASNNDMDMFREMNTAALIHKVNSLNPTVMNAETVCKMATIGGAKSLGLDKLTGSIEKGKKADIILVDMNQTHLTPLYNCYSQLVYAARGADVKTSIINGKIVMKDRQLRTIDMQTAMKNVRNIAAEIINQKLH